MLRRTAWTPVNRWLEPLLAAVVVAGIVYAMIFLLTRGYLPQPFFYDPYDIWMDWFNVADWAHDTGMYDSFDTIYPPLSFVFMKLIALPGCYEGASTSGLTAYYARDCDWLGIVWLHGFYILDVVLVAVAFKRIDPATAVSRSVALGMGMPMVFGLERGQIMLVAFACVVLAFGPILKSARARWLALALAINFKLYLLSLLFPQLLRRRWRWFEGALIATVLVYIVTYCLLGAGTPLELATNAAGFKPLAGNPLDLWLASTYSPFLALAENPVYELISVLGSDAVETGVIAAKVSLLVTQGMVLVAVVAAWLRPEAVSVNRLSLLGVGLAMVTVDSQYYAVSVMVYFVFVERWRGAAMKIAIICAYLLCLPIDYPIDQLQPLVLDTYIFGRTEIVTYSVMLGPFIRPGLMMIIVGMAACATIRAVWNDIATQGWRRRWRFHRDLPLLLGEGAAMPPLARRA